MISVRNFTLFAICLTAHLVTGCSPSSLDSNTEGSIRHTKQIPFDKSTWKNAEPIAGKRSLRESITKAVLARFPKKTSMKSVKADLGPAKLERKRADFNLGYQDRLPNGGADFLIYTVALSKDYVPHDMLFSFDSKGQLINIDEGIWNY